MGKEKTSAHCDTDDNNGDDEHASLFRNSFSVNSNFVFHSVDEVNRYLVIVYFSYYHDNYSIGKAINFLAPIV